MRFVLTSSIGASTGQPDIGPVSAAGQLCAKRSTGAAAAAHVGGKAAGATGRVAGGRPEPLLAGRDAAAADAALPVRVARPLPVLARLQHGPVHRTEDGTRREPRAVAVVVGWCWGKGRAHGHRLEIDSR